MIIKVKVKPYSIEDKIEKIAENEYIINVKEKAEKGKANKEVIKLISKYFNVNYKKVNIKNKSSRDKIIEIL